MTRQPRKHLQKSRANTRIVIKFSVTLEAPPHTWRILCSRDIRFTIVGNTSTYVKNSTTFVLHFKSRTKHLHTREDKSVTSSNISFVSETPPQMWRTHHSGVIRRNLYWNTSTRVKTTFLIRLKLPLQRKHLHPMENIYGWHVRIRQTLKHLHYSDGEICCLASIEMYSTETPPPKWRICTNSMYVSVTLWNTSTHVETMVFRPTRHPLSQKHLHIRED